MRPEHVDAALAARERRPGRGGRVGGGTGMICHGFKGGIGTASRVVADEHGGYTVGVLVQANHGRRERLRVDGVPVGRADRPRRRARCRERRPAAAARARSSCSCATDAPLLPHQCRGWRSAPRSASRAPAAPASTRAATCSSRSRPAHRDLPPAEVEDERRAVSRRRRRCSPTPTSTPLFHAAIEATEAAIVNALLAAETMTGRDGITAHALGAERLLGALRRLDPEKLTLD